MEMIMKYLHPFYRYNFYFSMTLGLLLVFSACTKTETIRVNDKKPSTTNNTNNTNNPNTPTTTGDPNANPNANPTGVTPEQRHELEEELVGDLDVLEVEDGMDYDGRDAGVYPTTLPSTITKTFTVGPGQLEFFSISRADLGIDENSSVTGVPLSPENVPDDFFLGAEGLYFALFSARLPNPGQSDREATFGFGYYLNGDRNNIQVKTFKVIQKGWKVKVTYTAPNGEEVPDYFGTSSFPSPLTAIVVPPTLEFDLDIALELLEGSTWEVKPNNVDNLPNFSFPVPDHVDYDKTNSTTLRVEWSTVDTSSGFTIRDNRFYLDIYVDGSKHATFIVGARFQEQTN